MLRKRCLNCNQKDGVAGPKSVTEIGKDAFASASFPGGSEGDDMLVTQGENQMGIELQLDEDGKVRRIDLVLP